MAAFLRVKGTEFVSNEEKKIIFLFKRHARLKAVTKIYLVAVEFTPAL